jgi:hypothetical protein
MRKNSRFDAQNGMKTDVLCDIRFRLGLSVVGGHPSATQRSDRCGLG